MYNLKQKNGLTINNPDVGEKTLFLDIDNKLKTKDDQGIIEEISLASANEPKVYVALLTQSGTNAPVATVLKNTLGSEVVWSYTFEGIYNGATTNSIFSPTKTIGYTYSGWDDDSNFIGFIVSVFDSTNIRLINTINDRLDNHVSIRVKIEVYP